MSETNLSEIITASLSEIKEFANAETIVGEPMVLPSGTSIIPISKVSMGFASGGLDYGRREISPRQKSFTGGGGTGVSITPIAFLVASERGKVELLSVQSPKNINGIDKIASLIERSPDIISDIRDAFKERS